MFAVIISEKGGAERREIFHQVEITIGRVQGNDLTLPKGNVSKRHARLAQLEGRFVVTDQNSTNGTYVNRRRITQATIVREGDRIYIGDYVLRIEGLDEDEVTRKNQPRSVAPTLSGEEPSATSEMVPVSEDVPVPPAAESARPSRNLDDEPSVVEIAPDFAAAASATSGVDVEPSSASITSGAAFAMLVKSLVEGVTAKLEPRALDGEIADSLRRRVERLVSEQFAAQHREGSSSDTGIVQAALAELVDFGPLGLAVADPEILELTACGDSTTLITKASGIRAIDVGFSSFYSLERAVARLCRLAGTQLQEGEALIERSLPGGLKLYALRAVGGGVRLATLRRPRRVDTELEELVRRGTISRAIATFLRACVAGRINLLVVGARGSASADLLSALALGAADDHWLALQSREAFMTDHTQVTQVNLAEFAAAPDATLSFAARMTHARLLVENFSGRVAAAVLDAIASGTDGVVAAVAAPSIRRALMRIPADIAASHPGYDPSTAWEALVTSFEILVEIASLKDGRDRVLRVCEVQRSPDGGIDTTDIFGFTAQRTAAGGMIEGTFYASGAEPNVAYELRARSITVESSLFKRHT